MKTITLFIFGGVSNIEQEPRSPGIEFQMTIVGPLTTLIIGELCFLLLFALPSVPASLGAMLAYLGITNLVLGLFNLVPGSPWMADAFYARLSGSPVGISRPLHVSLL